jgi:malate dehydrogenase (oxaloacetate-decarboxylating)(NADP+)
MPTHHTPLHRAAAEAVAAQVTEQDFASGLIYPPVRNIRWVSFEVAVKIAGKIYELGLARTKRPRDIRRFIASTMYSPVYR